ncbi:MAG: hypothetical protein WC975_00635 [Phycisphaerae bacterium]
MRTITRKWIVVGIVVAILLTSRIYDVARWLERYDLIYNAREFEGVYITGTTLAILAALIFLLKNNGNGSGHGSSHEFHPHHRRNRRDF